jgi:hypothetical protein
MFIEYCGRIFARREDDLETAWLLAKNAHVPHVRELVKLVRTAELYGCRFAQHEAAISAIKRLGI